jgi:hypothetical protein
MFNYLNEKMTMMNVLVKEGKDLVLEALLNLRNAEMDDDDEKEEEEINQLVDRENDVSNNADLKGLKAKLKKPTPKVKAKVKVQVNLNEGAGNKEGGTDKQKK